MLFKIKKEQDVKSRSMDLSMFKELNQKLKSIIKGRSYSQLNQLSTSTQPETLMNTQRSNNNITPDFIKSVIC